MDAINNYHFFNFRFNNSTRISFTAEKVVRDHSYLSVVRKPCNYAK